MAQSLTQGRPLLSSAVPRRGTTDQPRGLRDTTRSMVPAHLYREQHAIVRTLTWFVALATPLYLFFGPIGILYALGLEAIYLVIYLLTTAFASFLDPDVY